MNNANCTDTIVSETSYHVAPLSWGDWIGEGKRLVTNEARKTMNMLTLWQRRAQARHAMAEMGEHLMDDMGLSRQDVLDEAAKPFWRA